MSMPLTVSSPESGRSRPLMERMSTLLPEPDGPMTTTFSPSATSSETPLSASTFPKFFLRSLADISGSMLPRSHPDRHLEQLRGNSNVLSISRGFAGATGFSQLIDGVGGRRRSNVDREAVAGRQRLPESGGGAATPIRKRWALSLLPPSPPRHPRERARPAWRRWRTPSGRRRARGW